MSTPPPLRVAPPLSLLVPQSLWGLNKVLPAREYPEICSFQTVFVDFMARESPPRSFETGVTLPISQMGIIGALKVTWLVSRSPYTRVIPSRVAPPPPASPWFASEGTGLDTQQMLAGSQF